MNAYNEILNLPEFTVSESEIKEDTIVLKIESLTKKQKCNNCKSSKNRIHSSIKQSIRDLSISGRIVKLEIQKKKFLCKKCGKIFAEYFDSIEHKHIYTKRYEKYIFLSCFERSISTVSLMENLPYGCVRGIYERYSEQCVKELKKYDETVRIIGIDEVSIKKGHNDFQAIISNINEGYVIEVLPDRKKEKIVEFLQNLPENTKKCIIYASIDMWEGYFQAIREVLKKAVIVIDRFHVMKNLNAAISNYRRIIQRGLPSKIKDKYKGYRWILVKNEENMTEEQKKQLEDMKKNCPELKRIYELKREFQKIFNEEIKRNNAEKKISEWEKKVKALKNVEMDKFLKTLNNWREWILNYFSSGKVSNGFVEGMNNRIKLIKRIGYGYNNRNNFRMRVLVECGHDKLKRLKNLDF